MKGKEEGENEMASCLSKLTLKMWDIINNIISTTQTFPKSFTCNEDIITDKTVVANTFNNCFTNTG